MPADWDLLYLEAVNYAFITNDATTRAHAIEIAENYRKLLEFSQMSCGKRTTVSTTD